LGIIDFLQDKYSYLTAQRLGELCQLITGKNKLDDFRKVFHNDSREQTCKAFTEKAKREVKSQLVKFGIDVEKQN
jgi:hypothetical protein